MARGYAELSSGPDVALVSICVGLSIAATEVSRYTSLWTRALPSSPWRYLALLAFLLAGMACVALVSRRTGHRPYASRPLRLGVTALGVVGFALRVLYQAGALAPSFGLSVLVGIGMEAPYLLMAAAAPLMLRFEPHAAMRAVSLGLIAAGCAQLLVLALAPSWAAYALAGLLAPASCWLLGRAVARSAGGASAEGAPDGARGTDARPGWAWADDIDPAPAAFLMACALCMVALASTVIYFVHAGWSEARMGGAVSPVAVQLFAGVGVAAAGLVLHAIAPYLRRKDVSEFCFMLVIPLLALCLCLFNMVEGAARVALLVPLNVAYAALLFLTWCFAFSYPVRAHPAEVALLAFLVKRAGVLACPALLMGMRALGVEQVWVAFWALTLLLCLSVAHYIVLHACRRPPAAGAGGAPEPQRSRETALEQACAQVAGEHGLTPREAEVLALLARGRTAAHISGALSMSMPTARTHIQHIYRKLGVGSQQALLDVMEERMAGGGSPGA